MCMCCLCDADDDDFDSINIMSKSINKRWEKEIPPWPSLFTLIYIVKYTYTHIYLCMSLYNICVYVYRVWMCIYIYKLNIIIIVCVYIEKGDLIMSYWMMNDDDYYASCCLLFYVCVCVSILYYLRVWWTWVRAFEIYMWVFMMMLLLLLFCCCVFQLI